MKRKWIYWIITGFVFLFLIGSITNYCNQIVVPNTIDNAFVNYEQFQEIYNTCQKLNTDLGNMKLLPKDDAMFAQFSKEQRIYTIKTQLNRWIEDLQRKVKNV